MRYLFILLVGLLPATLFAAPNSRWLETCADFGERDCVIYGYGSYGYQAFARPYVVNKINQAAGQKTFVTPISDNILAILRSTGMRTVFISKEEVTEKSTSDLREGYESSKVACLKDEATCGFSIFDAVKKRGLGTLIALASCGGAFESCWTFTQKYLDLVKRLDELEKANKIKVKSGGSVVDPNALDKETLEDLHPTFEPDPNMFRPDPDLGTVVTGNEPPQREGYVITILDPITPPIIIPEIEPPHDWPEPDKIEQPE